MARSELTIDLGAIRRNARTLLRVLEGAELWAVVKADGYGHGAADVGGAALGAGATALCVATVPEGLALRQALGSVRVLVLGPATSREIADARDAGLELVIADGEMPEGVQVHVKLDTGMGRWGIAELDVPGREVVGLMSHFASADFDTEFTEQQVERFRAATELYPHLTRHIANSAGALAYPVSPLRRGALRHRALRHLSLRHRPGRGRAGARAPLGLRARPGQAPAAGRVDRVRPPLDRETADVDRDRPGRIRGRLPARPDRDRGAGRG